MFYGWHGRFLKALVKRPRSPGCRIVILDEQLHRNTDKRFLRQVALAVAQESTLTLIAVPQLSRWRNKNGIAELKQFPKWIIKLR